MSEVIIRLIDIEKDAQALADMWNASDLQWPSTWTGGVPVTADAIREWHEHENADAVWVAQVGDAIAGYCSLVKEHHGHPNEAYVDILNVCPEYQGRSIGRRLLQASIAYSVANKLPRQTLGTWSANFKAVPTYKKTGHFWRPDTGADMENFVPGALQLSLAQRFFARHDWYTSYVRDLEQRADEEVWEGVKVYTQVWRADGESLTIRIDREAMAPIAVETDDLAVAGLPAVTEPLTGSRVALRWCVSNKTSEPLPVILHALGDKGLEIDHRAVWTVPPGETVERTAEVSVADDAPRAKDDGTAPAVRSILRLGDQEVELFTGLRARKRWSLDTLPGEVTLRPGQPSTIQLQLHNECPEPVAFGLRLIPPEGLETDWQVRRGKLPAKGHLTIPLTLTAAQEGILSLPLRASSDVEGLQPLNETITLFSLAAGGMLAQQSGQAIRIETDALRISIKAKDSAVLVRHKRHDLGLIGWRPTMGPPYWPSSLADQTHDMELSWVGGRVRVDMHCEDKVSKGLYLYQRMTISSDGTITLDRWMENRGETGQTRSLRLSASTHNREIVRLSLPLEQGLVQVDGTSFPTGDDDVPRDPSRYHEPWMAWELRDIAAGVCWDGLCGRIDKGWGLALDSDPLTVAPGERSQVVRCAFAAGEGDWRQVRRLSARWAGTDTRKELPLRAPLQARLASQVLTTVDDTLDTTLTIDSAMKRVAEGQVTLRSDTLLADPGEMPFALNRENPKSVPLRIDLPEAPGVYGGEVRLDTPLWHPVWPFQVVRLGDGRRVEVRLGRREGLPVWTIDSGPCVWQLCSQFGPSVVSWRMDGQEQLWSPFPEPTSFSWTYPYFAGVHSTLKSSEDELWQGVLHRERLSARIIESRDVQGIPWRGVRLVCDPRKKALRGLHIELDYVAVGGGPVLKHVVRLQNRRGSRIPLRSMLTVAYSLGADHKALSAHTAAGERQATNLPADLGELGWAALRDPQSDRTGLLVGAQPSVLLWDAGAHGRVLGAGHEHKLDCDRTHELVYYMVVTDDYATAMDHLALGQIGRGR